MNVLTNNTLKSTIALAALEMVTDPEIGLNVVDLGLIYQIDFDQAAKSIYLSVTPTIQLCPMGASIADAVTRSIENTFTGPRSAL